MGCSSRKWCVVVAMVVVVVRGDIEQDKAECMDQLIGLATCLPYVGGDAKAPTFECCAGAKKVVENSMKCLCILVKDRDDKSLGLTINVTKALGLPASCHVSANLTLCIDLLHLPLNSTDAKVYEDFANTIQAKNTTSVPAAITMKGNSSDSSSLSNANATSDGGLRSKKKWIGCVEMVSIGVSALLLLFTSHL